MGELLSWHKPGQKVAVLMRSGSSWVDHRGVRGDGPGPEDVITIGAVRIDEFGDIGLSFFEWKDWYSASNFRPVYPSIIDSLRNLTAPADEREVEHV